MRVLPGDPAVFFASGPNAGKEEIEVIRKQMGLDKPVPEQLMLYLYDVGRGNLGRSLMTGQSVTTDLRERLPASLELTLDRTADRAGVGGSARRDGGLEAGLGHRPRGAAVLCARGLRADLRVRPAADLRLLLPARPRARSDRAGRYLHVAAAVAHRLPVDRLPAGRRSRRMVGRASATDPAGGDHGAVRDRAAGAHHPRLDAGLARQRFRAHRALGRPVLVAHCRHLCVAQRHPAGHHHRRHRVLDHARRQCAG